MILTACADHYLQSKGRNRTDAWFRKGVAPSLTGGQELRAIQDQQARNGGLLWAIYDPYGLPAAHLPHPYGAVLRPCQDSKITFNQTYDNITYN